MSTLKVSTIQDVANSNTAISIDSSGRVTTPAKPAFFAYLTADQTITLNSWDKICLLYTSDAADE